MMSWSWRQPGSTLPGKAASTPCPGWTPAWRWCSTLTMETACAPARRKEQFQGTWTSMVAHRGIPRLSPQPQASSVHCTRQQMFIPKHFKLLEAQHWTMFSYFGTWYSYHRKANQIPLANPSYKYCKTFGNPLPFLLWRGRGIRRCIYVSVQKHSCTLCTTVFVGICRHPKKTNGIKNLVSVASGLWHLCFTYWNVTGSFTYWSRNIHCFPLWVY